MNKFIAALFIPVIVFGLANCGGTPSSGNSMSRVTLNIGGSTAVSSVADPRKTMSSIPASVNTISITISGPEMETIARELTVQGRDSFSETFDVPNGQSRHFLAEARDIKGNVLYTGSADAHMNGNPVTLNIEMLHAGQPGQSPTPLPSLTPTPPPTPGQSPTPTPGQSPSPTPISTPYPIDIVPPSFGGVYEVVEKSSTEIRVLWPFGAIDNVTQPGNMVYLVYMASRSGGQNLAVPNFTTPKGATSLLVTGLKEHSYYCFIVRAKDEAGNIDTNTVERCAWTLQPPTPTPSPTPTAMPTPPPAPLSVSPAAGTICENDTSCPAGTETIMFNIAGGVPPYSITSNQPLVIPNAAGIPGPAYIADAIDHSIMGGPGTVNVSVTISDSAVGNASVNISVTNQQWYVNAAGGSDTTGNGTLANPFKTITKAVASVAGRTGDFIYTLPGTYDLANGETFPLNFGATAGITLDCGGATMSNAGAIYNVILGGNNLAVRNCIIYTPEVSYFGIDDNGFAITIDNCTIDGLNTGSGVLLKANSILQNSVIINHASYPIEIDSNSPTISGNTIQNNILAIAGIVTGASSSPTITGNTIQNNTRGIEIWNNAAPTITSNTIQNNSTDGIIARGASSPVISNNIILENPTGIRAWNTSSPIISSNTIRTVSIAGLLVGIDISDSVNPSITNNIIQRHTYGIYRNGMSTPTISVNTITDNTTGIYVGGVNSGLTAILSNSISTGDNGIVANTPSQISSNTIQGHNIGGIVVGGAGAYTISGNSVFNNSIFPGNFGIRISNNSASAAITGNKVCGNNGYGVDIANSMTSTTVNNNQIYQNSYADLRDFLPSPPAIDATNNFWDNIPPTNGGGVCSGGVDTCNASIPATVVPSAGLAPATCP